MGLAYEQWRGLPARAAVVLRWLAGYRHARHRCERDAADAVVAAFASGSTLRMGVARAVRASGLPQSLALSAVYHFLWTGRLQVDMQAPLGWASLVEVAG